MARQEDTLSEAAFEQALREATPRVRGLLRRMLANREDVDEVFQRSTLKAWQALQSFRGDASFATWLHAIAARQALDFLKAQKRYRAGALIYAKQACIESGEVTEVIRISQAPDQRYDVYEHIAYCFACVGRSLPPEAQAALVLRDVEGYGNDEAAKALGLSSSVFRHHLSAGRRTLDARFEGLCALVNKQGVCYQCEGLRGLAPSERQGVPADEALNGQGAHLKRRLQVVRDADIDTGASQPLHDLLARQLHRLEQAQSDEVDRECIPADDDVCRR